MKIAIDLSAVRTTGTLVYARGFVPAFIQALNPGDELTVFAPNTLKPVIAALAAPKVRILYNPLFANVPGRLIWQQSALPGLLAKFRIDVLFEPFDMAPWRRKCPVVLGIRNPTPVLLATRIIRNSWRRTAILRLHQALVRRSCRSSDAMIFPSKYAADSVGTLLGVPVERRNVVHHGLDFDFAKTAPAGGDDFPAGCLTPGGYVLFASKLYRQKRALLLVEAFHQWRSTHGDRGYRLAFCGEDREPMMAELRSRVDALGLSRHVDVLGVVSRTTLTALYRNAAVLALPTVMETFGFPYVEAMACRVPLVCADIPIARELCGDAPYYFMPDDKTDFASALERAVYEGPERDGKLTIGAERAAGFSWEREAEETMACIRKVRTHQT